VFAQTLCATCGLLLACTLPVQRLAINDLTLKTWIVALCVVVLAFLPALLPTLLTPTLGMQQRLRVLFYVALIGLFVANFCFR